MRFSSVLFSLLTTFALSTTVASAQFIRQPVAVSSTAPADAFPIGNLINQSGLSAAYVSGVTNFNTFTATTTGFNGTGGVGGVGSAPPVNFDFDLGAVFPVDAIAVWNQSGSASLVGFTLFADTSATFSSAVNLGNFTMTQFGTTTPNVFTFGSTSARFFRIAATSNQGFAATRFDEFAVRSGAAVGAAAPEPASLALLALSAMGGLPVVGAVVRRNRLSSRRRSG